MYCGFACTAVLAGMTVIATPAANISGTTVVESSFVFKGVICSS
jgi:hypothetical protein